jgi:hypothetical protein
MRYKAPERISAADQPSKLRLKFTNNGHRAWFRGRNGRKQPGDEGSEIGKPVCRRAQHDYRDIQHLNVLLECQVAIDRKEHIEGS